MEELACCTQLPDGLCQLPCLHFFQVWRAPAIKRIGPEFLNMQPSSIQRHHAHAFPRLKTLKLFGMVEWEEWDWDQQRNNAQAMPALENLLLRNCKLRCLPPGLSSQAKALTIMYLYNIQQLNSVESFASLVELRLFDNPNLERVTSLPSLHRLHIVRCMKMRALVGVPELQKLVFKDLNMEKLPGYLLKDVSPRHLVLYGNLKMLTTIAAIETSQEWIKLSQFEHVNAYSDMKQWHVLYTKDPYSFETNIGNSSSSS
uniref:NB-ARC domain-containing protein n=1 Tax=Leersia perrieri TaxID=77586 RepID=A0A0D9XVP6_9ORYZ